MSRTRFWRHTLPPGLTAKSKALHFHSTDSMQAVLAPLEVQLASDSLRGSQGHKLSPKDKGNLNTQLSEEEPWQWEKVLGFWKEIPYRNKNESKHATLYVLEISNAPSSFPEDFESHIIFPGCIMLVLRLPAIHPSHNLLFTKKLLTKIFGNKLPIKWNKPLKSTISVWQLDGAMSFWNRRH